MFRVRVICNKEQIKNKLDGRTLNWLLNEVNKYEGINLSASNFYSLINNQNNWLLKYAYVIAQVLKCSIEEIFFTEQ